jgi:hypothetical protein
MIAIEFIGLEFSASSVVRFKKVVRLKKGRRNSYAIASFYPEIASMPFRGIGKKKCDFPFLAKSIS